MQKRLFYSGELPRTARRNEEPQPRGREVGEAGAFDNRPRPREEALKKLEERAGADARRLFEAFLRKIDKLQEASASH
jgi:hypothetical protein